MKDPKLIKVQCSLLPRRNVIICKTVDGKWPIRRWEKERERDYPLPLSPFLPAHIECRSSGGGAELKRIIKMIFGEEEGDVKGSLVFAPLPQGWSFSSIWSSTCSWPACLSSPCTSCCWRWMTTSPPGRTAWPLQVTTTKTPAEAPPLIG